MRYSYRLTLYLFPSRYWCAVWVVFTAALSPVGWQWFKHTISPFRMVPYIWVLMQVLLKAMMPYYDDFCCKQSDRTAVHVTKLLTCLCAELHTCVIWSPHWTSHCLSGGTWRSWLRHCTTSRKVAGSIPDGVIGIFHWHNTSGRTAALRLTQSLTEMSTRNISWKV